mgnify:CR=1 FL=1
MSLDNFNEDLIRQVDEDIYLNGRDPEPINDPQCPGFQYTFFLFTKWNPESGIQWNISELPNDWRWIGGSWLGDWRENQFGGPGPVSNLYDAEMIIRSMMSRLVSQGVLTDFKIRYRFPTLN